MPLIKLSTLKSKNFWPKMDMVVYKLNNLSIQINLSEVSKEIK